jgi:hypothetical protein
MNCRNSSGSIFAQKTAFLVFLLLLGLFAVDKLDYAVDCLWSLRAPYESKEFKSSLKSSHYSPRVGHYRVSNIFLNLISCHSHQSQVKSTDDGLFNCSPFEYYVMSFPCHVHTRKIDAKLASGGKRNYQQ